tara:strand:+ start:2044 stop:2598 length:555 start_codon:yes stop_codon:yes gene_type:complete
MAIWNALSNVLYGGNANYQEFSSISGDYQHLCIKALVRNTQASIGSTRYYQIQLGNSSVSTSTSDYSYSLFFEGGGSIAASSATSGTSNHIPAYYMPNDGAPSDTFGYFEMWVFDYSSTSKNKQVGVSAAMNPGTSSTNFHRGQGMSSGNYLSTSAVDVIRLTPSGDQFKAGSEFTLYGVNGAD